LVSQKFNMLRRYTPEFLDALKLRAAPATQRVLDAIEVVRGMNSGSTRKVPADAPTAFIKPRWRPLVIANGGIDRRFYEICVLSELKNSLRSDDIWIQGPRQFRDFEEYLLPPEKFAEFKHARTLPVAVNPYCEQYLLERLSLLEEQLATANRLVLSNKLPDAIVTESGLKTTPLDTVVPAAAQLLIDQASNLLPHIKITELLVLPRLPETSGRYFGYVVICIFLICFL
jgi:hypothetical protein